MAKPNHSALIQEALTLGDLFFEKCALDKSREAFFTAFTLAKRHRDYAAAAEALTGLVRLANEALDDESTTIWADELEAMVKGKKKLPAMVWYCRGAIARHRRELRLAQRCFHRYLREVRVEKPDPQSARVLTQEDGLARGWSMIAVIAFQRGDLARARVIGEQVLKRFEAKRLRRVNGNMFLLMGKLAERERRIDDAMVHFRKSHAAFLAEHNWYYHLHVLYAYARLARAQQNYPQAYWYLELMEQAVGGPGFGAMQKEIQAERKRLEQDAVDLLIDSRKAVVRTRESGQISLRKQYVLLNILEALSTAHDLGGEAEGGLSKAEIIQKVWNEPYRPEAHDNKLYYNINRLRKLIEPDMKSPQYLLNWREGYRLAPGLRVQRLGSAGRARLDG
jgi:DNA-binding winged helix-turn-helix (wHTH) protein